MTADAGADYLEVIDLRHRRKGNHGMTTFTGIRRCKMADRLADHRRVVVTTDAITGDVVVVEIRRGERGRRMAVVATVAAFDMSRVLARRCHTIVTTDASAEHLLVIDLSYRSERNDGMTVLTNRRRCHMVYGLADRFEAVVAARAVASDVVMIEIGRDESDGGMTPVARVAALNMRRSFADRRHVIVTADAATDHLRMIDL